MAWDYFIYLLLLCFYLFIILLLLYIYIYFLEPQIKFNDNPWRGELFAMGIWGTSKSSLATILGGCGIVLFLFFPLYIVLSLIFCFEFLVVGWNSTFSFFSPLNFDPALYQALYLLFLFLMEFLPKKYRAIYNLAH